MVCCPIFVKKQVIRKRKKENTGALNVLLILLCILLLPILVVNTTLIFKGLGSGEAVPTFAGYAPMIVLSDSMYPEIQRGDMILVKEADAGSVKEGDVISFFDPDSSKNAVVTHRVKEIMTEEGEIRFRTQGDANNAEDRELVPAENLVGIWTGDAFAGIGSAALFIQSTPGMILCIGLPVLLLAASELLRRRRYERKRQEDTDALMAELNELRAQKAASNL